MNPFGLCFLCFLQVAIVTGAPVGRVVAGDAWERPHDSVTDVNPMESRRGLDNVHRQTSFGHRPLKKSDRVPSRVPLHSAISPVVNEPPVHRHAHPGTRAPVENVVAGDAWESSHDLVANVNPMESRRGLDNVHRQNSFRHRPLKKSDRVPSRVPLHSTMSPVVNDPPVHRYAHPGTRAPVENIVAGDAWESSHDLVTDDNPMESRRRLDNVHRQNFFRQRPLKKSDRVPSRVPLHSAMSPVVNEPPVHRHAHPGTRAPVENVVAGDAWESSHDLVTDDNPMESRRRLDNVHRQNFFRQRPLKKSDRVPRRVPLHSAMSPVVNELPVHRHAHPGTRAPVENVVAGNARESSHDLVADVNPMESRRGLDNVHRQNSFRHRPLKKSDRVPSRVPLHSTMSPVVNDPPVHRYAHPGMKAPVENVVAGDAWERSHDSVTNVNPMESRRRLDNVHRLNSFRHRPLKKSDRVPSRVPLHSTMSPVVNDPPVHRYAHPGTRAPVENVVAGNARESSHDVVTDVNPMESRRGLDNVHRQNSFRHRPLVKSDRVPSRVPLHSAMSPVVNDPPVHRYAHPGTRALVENVVAGNARESSHDIVDNVHRQNSFRHRPLVKSDRVPSGGPLPGAMSPVVNEPPVHSYARPGALVWSTGMPIQKPHDMTIPLRPSRRTRIWHSSDRWANQESEWHAHRNRARAAMIKANAGSYRRESSNHWWTKDPNRRHKRNQFQMKQVIKNDGASISYNGRENTHRWQRRYPFNLVEDHTILQTQVRVERQPEEGSNGIQCDQVLGGLPYDIHLRNNYLLNLSAPQAVMSKIWHDNRKHCCKRRQKVKRGLHHSKMVPMPKSVDDISRPRNLEESQVKFVEATLSGGRDEHTKHQPLPKTRDSIEIVQEADTMPVDKIQRGPDTMRHNILGDRLRYMGGKNTNTPQWVRYMTPSIRHNLETPGLKKVPQKVMFTIPLSARSHATPVIEDPLKGIRDIIKNRHYFLTTEEAEEEMYPILSNSVCNQQSNERKTVSTQSYKIPNVTPTRGESTTEGPQEAVYPIPFDPSCDEYPTKDQVTEPTTQWENCSVKPTTKKICTKGRQSTVYPTPSDTDNGGCPIRSKVSKQEPTNSDKDNMTPARKNVCGEWQRTQFQKSTPPFTVEYRTEGKVCTRQPQVEEQTTESYTTENASTTPVTFKFNPVAAGPIWTWPMDVLLSVLSKMQKNENNPTTLISTQDAEQVLRGLTTPQEEEPVTQHENRQEESKQEDYSKTNHQNTEENNTEKRVNDIDHQNEEIHQILEEMLAMMAASNNGLETTSQTPGTGWAPILNETTPSTRIKPCSD